MSALLALALLAAPAAPPNLDGTWLFDECVTGTHDDLGRFWTSIVTVKGDRFTVTKLMWNAKDLTGRLAFDPTDPDAVDLVIDELDFDLLQVKVPGGTYRGTFDTKADRFTLAIARDPGGKRPEKREPSQKTFFAALTRAPAGFKEFPAQVVVRVTGADGKPAAGATAGSGLHKLAAAKGGKPEWQISGGTPTGPDGTVKFPYSRPPSVVRDEKAGTLAFLNPSPARLAVGELRVALAPECRIVGKIVSPELTGLGLTAGWTDADLSRAGRSAASCNSTGGEIELFAPPGTYTLGVSGEHMSGKIVPLVVPPGLPELVLPPVELKASTFTRLRGQPAPEFEGVMGWSGKPVTLADLKGQWVLVDFWGFWCGPCVKKMPQLVELHETFGGKGLAVVGVHMDLGGDVNTAAKLDAKMAQVVKEVWKGKSLPFPSALVSGKFGGEDGRPGGMIRRYGINAFPTTVLIDPEGRVVGKFSHDDIKSATAAVEKLLKK